MNCYLEIKDKAIAKVLGKSTFKTLDEFQHAVKKEIIEKRQAFPVALSLTTKEGKPFTKTNLARLNYTNAGVQLSIRVPMYAKGEVINQLATNLGKSALVSTYSITIPNIETEVGLAPDLNTVTAIWLGNFLVPQNSQDITRLLTKTLPDILDSYIGFLKEASTALDSESPAFVQSIISEGGLFDTYTQIHKDLGSEPLPEGLIAKFLDQKRELEDLLKDSKELPVLPEFEGYTNKSDKERQDLKEYEDLEKEFTERTEGQTFKSFNSPQEIQRRDNIEVARQLFMRAISKEVEKGQASDFRIKLVEGSEKLAQPQIFVNGVEKSLTLAQVRGTNAPAVVAIVQKKVNGVWKDLKIDKNSVKGLRLDNLTDNVALTTDEKEGYEFEYKIEGQDYKSQLLYLQVNNVDLKKNSIYKVKNGNNPVFLFQDRGVGGNNKYITIAEKNISVDEIYIPTTGHLKGIPMLVRSDLELDKLKIESLAPGEEIYDEAVSLLQHTYANLSEAQGAALFLNSVFSVGDFNLPNGVTSFEDDITHSIAITKRAVSFHVKKTDEGFRVTTVVERIKTKDGYRTIPYGEQKETIGVSDTVHAGLQAARINIPKVYKENIVGTYPQRFTVKDGKLIEKEWSVSDQSKFISSKIKTRLTKVNGKLIPAESYLFTSLEDRFSLKEPEESITKTPTGTSINGVIIEAGKSYKISDLNFKFENARYLTQVVLQSGNNPDLIFASDSEMDSMLKGSLALYKDGKIYIRLSEANQNNLPGWIEEELLHAFTFEALQKDEIKTSKEYIQLDKLRSAVRNQYPSDAEVQYYTESMEEFVTSLARDKMREVISNPVFENVYEEKQQDTNFLDYIKSLLDTLLQKVLDSFVTDGTLGLMTVDVLKIGLGKTTQVKSDVLRPADVAEGPTTTSTSTSTKKTKLQLKKTTLGSFDRIDKGFEVPVAHLDMVMSQILWDADYFTAFVNNRVEVSTIVEALQDAIQEEFEEATGERKIYLGTLLSNSDHFREWAQKSNLFKITDDSVFALFEEEEGSQYQERTEQTVSSIDDGSKYARIFFKMIPAVQYKDGQYEIKKDSKGNIVAGDYTSIWNTFADMVAGSLTLDEMISKAKNSFAKLPEIKVVLDRLDQLNSGQSEDPNVVYSQALVLKGIEKSFSKFLVPTLVINAEIGYGKEMAYNVYDSGRLDGTNLSNAMSVWFRDFVQKHPEVTTGGALNFGELYRLINKKLIYSGTGKQDGITNKSLIAFWEELGLVLPDTLDIDTNLKVKTLDTLRNFTEKLKSKLSDLKDVTPEQLSITSFDLFELVRAEHKFDNFKSGGYPTAVRDLRKILGDVLPFSTSNMTKNAEGENQSNLHNFSSWLLYVKHINDFGTNNQTALVERVPRLANPIAKHSLALKAVRNGSKIEPFNLSGTTYIKGDKFGINTINLNPIDYVRQEMTTMFAWGVKENLRAETASSSFSFRVQYGAAGQYLPVGEVNVREKAQRIYFDYLKGELERIMLERKNPVNYAFKYNNVKEGFTFFRDILSENTKNALLKYIDEGEMSDTLIQSILDRPNFVNIFNKELDQYFDREKSDFSNWIQQESGLKLDVDHPIFKSDKVSEKLTKLGSVDNLVDVFIINAITMSIEEIIMFHGEVGQFDKYYKRSKSTISNGTPAIISSKTQEILNNHAQGRTFSEAFGKRPEYYADSSTVRSIVLTEDKMPLNEDQKVNLEEGVLNGLKLTNEFFGTNLSEEELVQKSKEKVDGYSSADVSDGEGFVHPDAYRMLCLAVDSWSMEQEEGYQYLALKFKEKQGHVLTQEEKNHIVNVDKKVSEEGYYFQFPKLKFQYRGNTTKGNNNVAIEVLDKFALTPLFPDFIEDKPLAWNLFVQMTEQDIAYGKFASGTKIGTFKADSLTTLMESIQKGEMEYLNSEHTLRTEYLKEQVKTPDYLKTENIFGSQVRKLIISNLSLDGEFMDELKPFVELWKSSQKEIADIAKRRIIQDLGGDPDSLNPEINVNLLVGMVRKELSKRDLPEAYTYLFDNFEGNLLEESLSPQTVETLIYSVLKNRIVKIKYPGGQLVQVSSSLFNRKQNPSFETEKGSKYTYLPNGKSQRFKTAENKLQEPQDLLVFVPNYEWVESKNPEWLKQNNLKSETAYTQYLLGKVQGQESVWIINEQGSKFENTSEITGKAFIAFGKDGKVETMLPVNKEPTVGFFTYDTRVISRENGVVSRERHLGNKVTSINNEIGRDLEFYKVKDGRVIPADCKTTLSGDFLNLLNLPEVQEAGGDIRALNTLLKDDAFRDKYEKELTILAYRIPTQGFNSMDILRVKEFLPAYMGNTIVPPPQIVIKSGTDYDYDKMSVVLPSLSKEGLYVTKEGLDRDIEMLSTSEYQSIIKEMKREILESRTQKAELLDYYDQIVKDEKSTNRELKAAAKLRREVLGWEIEYYKMENQDYFEMLKMLDYLLDRTVPIEDRQEAWSTLKENNPIFVEMDDVLIFTDIVTARNQITEAVEDNYRLIGELREEISDLKVKSATDEIVQIVKGSKLESAFNASDLIKEQIKVRAQVVRSRNNLNPARFNETIEAAKGILLAPVNFARLVTPNTTKEIVQDLSGVLQKLYNLGEGERVNKEPTNTQVFSYTTHLKKWKAVKIKDLLGIGAVANTFYTLMQSADFKVRKSIVINKVPFNFTLPLLSEEEQAQFNLSNPFFIGSTLDKLEIINQFINLTVDAASDDIAGYTNMIRENTGFILFQIMCGVPFNRILDFIHQPVIYKYHQIVAAAKARGESTSDAQKEAYQKLLGIELYSFNRDSGEYFPKSAEKIWQGIRTIGYPSSFNVRTVKPIGTEVNETSLYDKEILVYYLVGLKQADALRELQGYLNFDTATSPSYKMSERREFTRKKIDKTNLFDLESADRIKYDSPISHLDVHDEFKTISKVAFTVKNFPDFVTLIANKSLDVYEDVETFIRLADNDFLMYIIQNFGDFNETEHARLKDLLVGGNLLNTWVELTNTHPDLKETLLYKKLIADPSKTSNLVNPSLFMGFDNQSEDFNIIMDEIRSMLVSSKDISDFAKDFIKVGFFQTGYNQTNYYLLKVLPPEVVSQFVKPALESFDKLPFKKKSQITKLFFDKFLQNRILEVGKYFRDYYGKDYDARRASFNVDSYRMLSYIDNIEEDLEVDISLEQQNPEEVLKENRKRAFEEAQEIVNERKNSPHLHTKEDWIADTLATVKVKASSFRDGFDKNNMMERLNFVNKKGQNLDVIAEDLSNRAGYEVTVEDVVDFIRDYKSVTDYWLTQQQRIMDNIEAQLNSKTSETFPLDESKKVDDCSGQGSLSFDVPF
jgi:hypothetical protein